MSINLSSYLETERARIEEVLDQLIPQRGSLTEAARYSLLAPAKRIRPILTLITAEILGASAEKALIPACAIELIHTYSLIHDDLPCMDNDDERRGQPSLHCAQDEATAVLTGDYLLTFAFELLSDAPDLTADQRLQLIQTLSSCAGELGMIGGQLLDIEYTGQEIDIETLQEIHLRKTGALINAAVEFGGIVSEASEQIQINLRQYGLAIGLAFQITDDILDAEDGEEEKCSYVNLLGIEGAKEYATKVIEQALLCLDEIPAETERLKEIAKQILERKI